MDDPNNPYARRGSVIDPSNPFASPIAEEARGERIYQDDRTLNPWISMWLEPRATIRQVMRTDPRRHVLLVTALGGACDIIDPDLLTDKALDYTIGVFIGQMLAGAAISVVGLFIMGWMVKVVAGWFGGVGTVLHTRAAIGWGYVPVAWALPLIVTFNILIMTVPADGGDGRIALAILMIAVLTMMLIGIWQLIITSCAIAEVFQFTGFGGFGVLLLAGLIVLCVLFILMLPFLVLFAPVL